MVKIQIRRDTAANWAGTNPTPAAGEPCFETDSGVVKVGDGVTAYNSLEPVGDDMTAAEIVAAINASAEIIDDNNIASTIARDSEVASSISSHASDVDAHHTNANDPTADQKAALAGTSGTPNVSNKFVTDGDPRMTDPRTPTSHTVASHSDTTVTGAELNALKTKVDGMEAGSTADQTKADIDALGINAAELGGNSYTDITDYVDSKVQGLDWQDSVQDIANDPSGLSGRFIVGTSPVGNFVGHANAVAEGTEPTWEFTAANEGLAAWVEDEDTQYTYNGSAWVKLGSTVDHGNLNGLGDDDHTQYYNSTRLNALKDAANGIPQLDSNGDLQVKGEQIQLTRDGSNYVKVVERTSGEVALNIKRVGTGDFELDVNTSGGDKTLLHEGSIIDGGSA